MKTDAISAATAYRMALLAILESKSLTAAQQHARQAILVEFNRPSEGTISVASGYGRNTHEPFVTLSIANPSESANPSIQMSSAEARRQALIILEAADAAESDGFVIEWLSAGAVALSQGQAAALLADFRDWRDRRRKE